MCTGNAYPFLFSGEWQRRAVGLRPTRGPDFYNRPGFLFLEESKSEDKPIGKLLAKSHRSGCFYVEKQRHTNASGFKKKVEERLD
jgi:hypothetical protein